jgi:DNA-binding CsgD family transcriptional regulator
MRPVLCPVLIGRETQTRHLLTALTDARASRGRTVLLAGEAGSSPPFLGLWPLLNAALGRDSAAPVPRRRRGDAGLPDLLRARNISGREADVLALVAQGLTNREIAERMFLSPRTVEKHVASLLAKTGLRRRAQLAGYLAQLSE